MMGKPQLFLFHFAGGSCNSYLPLTGYLNNKFEITPLELPGRGKRINEKLINKFDEASLDLFNQIRDLIHSDFIIYGHSMGAFLALRVANMLERIEQFPLSLIVSGNPGPGISYGEKKHLLNRKRFIEVLKRLGGSPKQFLENDDLFNFYEPILRADFQIAENHTLSFEPSISAPIFAIMGSREPKKDHIWNWSNYTKSNFNYQILEGGHFFINKYPETIACIIWKNYLHVAD